MIPADPGDVIAAARRWLGTPYHDQASVIGVGCDCLGLARGVWREVVGPEPSSIPPYTRDWGEAGPREVLAGGVREAMIEIAPDEAGPGALLLFRMRAGAIAKHIGIVMLESRFIHAYERLGVIEEPLTQAWRVSCSRFFFPNDESRHRAGRLGTWSMGIPADETAIDLPQSVFRKNRRTMSIPQVWLRRPSCQAE